MEIRRFQELIEQIYLAKDRARGVEGTFMWFTEEVGELARHLRDRDQAALEAEFADVLAWLVTLASITGVDVEAAALAKYGAGCPKCAQTPCACGERRGG